jgi:hypothetical protein
MTSNFQHAVEIKFDESSYWQAKNQHVPPTTYCELQHQLMLTDLKEIDYWCYFKGYDGILITVVRDDSYIENLLESEKNLYIKLK